MYLPFGVCKINVRNGKRFIQLVEQ